MSTGSANAPYFDWPDPETPAREVWYSLVTHPDEPVAFWYRYTLVSTADGSEARVWGALSDGRTGKNTFVSQQYSLGDVDIADEPFSLVIGENTLADDHASGTIEATDEESPQDKRTAPTTSWTLEYEPDEFTFIPLSDEQRMLEFAEQFGTGVHWSVNQSVSMAGEVTVGGRTIHFEDAPGHQGHTAGANAPDDWTWLHCNDFGDNISLEVLSMETLTPGCLRLPDETHLLNGDIEVFNAIETTVNEPGEWILTAETDDIAFSVSVAVDTDHWQRVSYLTPDGSLRYNAHCSLADVTLDVGGETYESSGGRIEWVSPDPPVAGSYPPFAP